ncbi:Putative lipoprotein YerB precursor [Bacillus sp. THAF10]|uniref:DUF3048 domain-containing protein n=1 Tax=Bacillus sp. THAF10 TaxID=2587848 RepID=UPI001268E511|nr:DUF3048 domain-containing protein [Bacillus sp. THAF10]QFT87449.1 Putative lipoprotein YerB precursor [Bacillus sp. THAF10]
MGNGKQIIWVLMLMLLLAGCKSDETKGEKTHTEEPEVTQETPSEEAEVLDEIVELKEKAPFTGAALEEKSFARPVAVMVNNDVRARPQSGLHKADIVYEILAEGDITRFLAIYQSEMPETIGPVRSARPYYVDLAKGYNGIYVFHGWSPSAREMIEAGVVDGINGLTYDGSLFKRASFRKAPHNSYITIENIRKGANQLNYPLEVKEADLSPFTFLEDGESAEVEGTATEYVKLAYSSRATTHVEYKYNQEHQHYVRYSAGEKHTDLETMEEITATNVFIVQTEHKIIDEQGRRYIDIQSGGQAILIQNGKRYDVEWQQVEGKILPFMNGKQVPLAPGKTWIQIVPDLNVVSY